MLITRSQMIYVNTQVCMAVSLRLQENIIIKNGLSIVFNTAKISSNSDGRCCLCKSTRTIFLHILWTCMRVQQYQEMILQLLNLGTDCDIPFRPDTLLLNYFPIVPEKWYVGILNLMTAASLNYAGHHKSGILCLLDCSPPLCCV